MKTLEKAKAREVFESVHGTVSTATWYRILKVFDSNLPLTLDNVKFVAEVRKLVPKSSVESLKVITNIKQTRHWIACNNYQITGELLLKQFKKQNIEIHPNTLTRWFKPLNGFSRTRYYTLNELMPVILYAHSYALKKQLKEVATGCLFKYY
jgi:hypothetical protein